MLPQTRIVNLGTSNIKKFSIRLNFTLFLMLPCRYLQSYNEFFVYGANGTDN